MSKMIAIQECSAGNDSVGSEWYTARTFDENTPIKDVLAWAKEIRGGGGKLVITYDDSEVPQ